MCFLQTWTYNKKKQETKKLSHLKTVGNHKLTIKICSKVKKILMIIMIIIILKRRRKNKTLIFENNKSVNYNKWGVGGCFTVTS